VLLMSVFLFFFFSSRRRHTRSKRDWSSDVCSSDLALVDGDQPVLGVVSAPALNRRWWAALGSGAWTGRSLSSASRMHVSGVRDRSEERRVGKECGGRGGAEQEDEGVTEEETQRRRR